MDSYYRGDGGDGNEDYLPSGSGIGRTFAYVRRSTADRGNKPLNTQIEVINNYSEKILKEKITKFFGDNGVSGSFPIEKRDGLQALFKEIEENKGDDEYYQLKVIIYDASRLARNVLVGATIKERIEKNGGVIHLASIGMAITNTTSDLFFNINLQFSTNERIQAMNRTKKSLGMKDWNPRKGFGWQFNGPKNPPTEIPEEQSILLEVKEMYCNLGKNNKEILSFLKEKYPEGRRCRLEKNIKGIERVDWSMDDVRNMTKGWKWGKEGGMKKEDLISEIKRLRKEENKNATEIYSILKGKTFDGKEIKFSTVKRYTAGELYPEWKKNALKTVMMLITNERLSNDDIIDILNEKHPRPIEGKKEWPRQTVGYLVKIAKENK